MTREKNKKGIKPAIPVSQKHPSKIGGVDARWQLVAVSTIVLVSFFAYLPVLRNGFLHWDDDKYLQNNPMIYSFNLKQIFSSYISSNYHPLTMLILSLEYHVFGFSAKGFHSVNLLLHLSNVILVFYAIRLLSNKIEVAAIASLFFGIHPLHVESVAWIAELKDLLYTFFFLASYIYYLKYLKDRIRKFYFISILLFTLSLLSKAMAVSLPLVLLLTDYFKGRKLDSKAWLEKLPFFALALTFGMVAVFAQKTTGAMMDSTAFSFPFRIIFACYAFISYLLKIFLPLRQSAYYPYPVMSGQDMPVLYYVYPLIILGLVIYIFYSIHFSRKIIFGLGFFSATVFFVLQLIPVGGAVMADRYSYLSSIGIFYLAGEGLYWLWNKKNLRVPVIALICFVTVFFSFRTYARCDIWKDDLTLWNDVISQYQTIPLAYSNRGNILKNEKRSHEALDDFNKAIALLPGFADAYLGRADLFIMEKRNEDALHDFNKAIELNPANALAYNNRGNLFADEKRDSAALSDYNKAIALKPDYGKAFNNRGILLETMKRVDEALADYNKAIDLQPDFSEAYYNRGLILMSQKKYAEALRDYDKTIALSPRLAEAYYYRALIEYNSNAKDKACLDLQQAAGLGYQPAVDAHRQFCH